MLLNCGAGKDSLRAPWSERRSKQSILKEISPEYSLEGLMLKLELQYFGHLIWRADSFEKTLMLGKTEGSRRRGWQGMRWLVGITDSKDMSLGKLQALLMTGRPGVLQWMGSQIVGHDWETELSDDKQSYDKPRQYIKKQRQHFAYKVHIDSYWFFQ